MSTIATKTDAQRKAIMRIYDRLIGTDYTLDESASHNTDSLGRVTVWARSSDWRGQDLMIRIGARGGLTMFCCGKNNSTYTGDDAWRWLRICVSGNEGRVTR